MFKSSLAVFLLGLSAVASAATPLTLYKSPLCGCCSAYVSYLRAQGFTLTVHDTDDMNSIRQRYKVSASSSSCHTALVGGYTVEGHVPAASIRKLLKERPAIAGIALPGMPASSPGMGPEQPGSLRIMTLEAKPRLFDVR